MRNEKNTMRSFHSLRPALHKLPCVSRLQIYMLERINKLLQKCVYVSAPPPCVRDAEKNKFRGAKSGTRQSVSSSRGECINIFSLGWYTSPCGETMARAQTMTQSHERGAMQFETRRAISFLSWFIIAKYFFSLSAHKSKKMRRREYFYILPLRGEWENKFSARALAAVAGAERWAREFCAL